MNISTVTQYISDTAAVIQATNPASSRIGVATDTGQLFISDGTSWHAQSNTGTYNQPWSLPSGSETVSQTPLYSFDASVTSSMLNNLGSTPSAGDSVASWSSNHNLGTFIEKRAVNQPIYKPGATPKNTPGVLFDDISNMSLNRAESTVVGLPLTIITVYTPTRDVRTIRQHDPGNSSTTAAPGGRYSKSGLGNYINRVWNNRDLRGLSNKTTATQGSIGLNLVNTNQYVHIEQATSMSMSITFPEQNYPAGTLFDHFNNNFLGKTQIHVCKIQPQTGTVVPYPFVNVVNTHLTWTVNEAATTAEHNHTTQYTDLGYNISGLQLGNESSYNTIHELLIFNHGLSRGDINNIGQHLFGKWCETNQTLLTYTKGYNAI